MVGACGNGGPSADQAEGGLVPVRIALTGHFLGKAPLYVAVGKDYFRQEGLDVSITVTNGGPAGLAALLSGDVGFSTNTMGEILPAVRQGQPVRVIAANVHQSNVICAVRPDVEDQLGVAQSASWLDKARALKGRTIGVTSVGGSIDQTLRYILERAGLDPNEDVNIVAVGVDTVAWVASLQQRRLDAMCSGIPIPQAVIVEGVAVAYVSPAAGEVPGLDGITDQTMATTEEYIKSNPEVVQKFVNALALAMKYIQDNSEDSARIIKEQAFPNLSQAAFDMAYADYRAAINTTPVMTPESFARSLELYEFTVGSSTQITIEDVYDGSFAEEAEEKAGGGQ